MNDMVAWLRGIPLLEITAVAYIGLLARKIKKFNSTGQGITAQSLILDLPLAVFMGIVSSGICENFSITGNASAALIAASGYIGPKIIDFFWDVFQDVWKKKKEKESL